MSVLRNLQKTVEDKSKLRYLTGEWFYETKQLRHQDRIHGSDIIRASMRHTHKPLTICESAPSCIVSPMRLKMQVCEAFNISKGA